MPRRKTAAAPDLPSDFADSVLLGTNGDTPVSFESPPNRKDRIPATNLEAIAELVTSFESPESGSIIRARYDRDTRQMWVELRKSAVCYRYTAIDAKLWEEFVQAKSKGQFFAQRIRPLYVGVKV